LAISCAAGKSLADSVQDDPETHSYNVQEMVDALVQKAQEWQDCVQGGSQPPAFGTAQPRVNRHAADLASTAVDHLMFCRLLYSLLVLVLVLLLLLQVMTCFSSWARTLPTATRGHGSATWIRCADQLAVHITGC
jgi:hypothetical protein